jgi:hypothetical protein
MDWSSCTAKRLLALSGGKSRVVRPRIYSLRAPSSRRPLALARTLADEHGTAVSLNSLGYTEFSEGKYLAAEGVLTGALDQFRTLEDPVGIALSLFGLANLAATQRRRHASRGLVRPESG